jgi:hypothetical protein
MGQLANQVPHSRRSRVAAKRVRTLMLAREILQAIVDGSLDDWEGYRRLYALYTETSGQVHELRPLFQVPSIEPDSSVKVTQALRDEIRRVSSRWLLDNPEPKCEQ